MRRSPRRWWFYGWLASLPITVFLVFLAPLAIDPLFYKYTPLAARHPALVTELEKVTARGGLRIPPSRMFEMHAGEKWNSLNAYVTGLGASKRVVVWDTTIARMTTPQIMFVFGHEMGHYVLGHMWLGMGATAIGLLVVLFASYHAMHAALRRWGARCRVRSIDDWASLPLLVLTGAILGFLAEPVSNGYSRVLEHHADIYGLEVVHSLAPRAAAMDSFQISGEVALDHPNPSPFIEFWRYSHPSTTRRMRFAGQYDPWTTGAPRKYIP
jgi:Zn-dependent protease with chaperone function